LWTRAASEGGKGFLKNLEDVIPENGEVALIVEMIGDELRVVGHSLPKAEKFGEEEIRDIYLMEARNTSKIEQVDEERLGQYFMRTMTEETQQTNEQSGEPVSVFASRYKPVALKTRPVLADLPNKYRIIRDIKGDPLEGMPELNTIQSEFVPTGRYTQERKEIMEEVHKGDFLWPEEKKLLHQVMTAQEKVFAWDDSERGRFRTDFFPPVVMPVVAHTPWVYRNIPIPHGIYEEVCKLVKKKIETGVYEPSNAPYRSRWFTVAKKDGKSLRIVHSLEPLNAVTIAHSGLPPATEELAAKFAGRACSGLLDLYVGYDERLLAEESRDLTMFQTPYGALRLVTLPMGWTNSVPIFHEDVTTILAAEIPDYTIPYIDDVPVRGPANRYEKALGVYETIPANSGIRRFVWEHMLNVNRILQRMKYCGGTFSGKKTIICADSIEILGHRCDYE
jgi:hypothetical protein